MPPLTNALSRMWYCPCHYVQPDNAHHKFVWVGLGSTRPGVWCHSVCISWIKEMHERKIAGVIMIELKPCWCCVRKHRHTMSTIKTSVVVRHDKSNR